ncbi:hypothetical protein D3C72_1947280 [compost metagenome]
MLAQGRGQNDAAGQQRALADLAVDLAQRPDIAVRQIGVGHIDDLEPARVDRFAGVDRLFGDDRRQPFRKACRRRQESGGKQNARHHVPRAWRGTVLLSCHSSGSAKRHVCPLFSYLRFLLTVAAISSAAWMILEFIS